MKNPVRTVRQENDQLHRRIEELELRLEEAEETLRAIRSGEVDSLVVEGPGGPQVYALEGVHHSYRALVEAMSEGAASLNPEGTILYCNGRFAEMVARPLSSVMGASIFEQFGPEGRAALEGLLLAGRRGESKCELAMRREDGGEVPALVSVRGVGEGTQRTLCLVATDLREQKRTEEILAADRLSRSVFDQANDVVVVCDELGRVLRASRAATDLLGEDPLRRDFDAAFPISLVGPATDRRDGHRGIVLSALQGQVLRAVPATFRRPGGEAAELLASTTPLRGGTDRIVGCVVTLVDVTEARRAAEAEHRYAEVLRLSDDAILVWAPGGEIEAWNPGATSLYGYTEDEARGRISSELLRSKAEVPWSAVEATLAASGHWEGELRQTARDGREFVVLAKLKVVVGVDGSRRVLESNRDITSRKLGEQALRQSELRFRSFFETPAVGAAEFSLDGRFVAVNDRCCEITGFSRDELLRMGPADLEPPEQAGHDVERLADYLEGHAGLYHHTKRYRRKDGTDVWVQVDAAVVRDDQGRPVRSAGVIVDVTDRVRAELGLQEALAASEKATAELDAIVQAIPHAVYFGTATGITRCNAEALHMLGASSLADLQARIGGVAERCRVRYRRDGGPVAPEDLPFSRALAGEKATLDTWATRADSGEDVLIRGNSAPVSVDGKTIGAVAVDIDVTQYHELQDRLRERERYFHELFEACPSGLVVLEPDARIVEFNERAHLQLGYTREEFARLELHQIDVNESAATLEARIARILREGADVFEARHRAKSGEIRDVIVEVRCTEQSGRKRLLSVWRDITERKQAERALLEADRNKDEFIAVLSHELRNPLGPITNSLFVLDRAAPTSEPATRARAAIRRQVAHMTRLVNDLLDVTRIARGRIQLNRERTDLRETVGRAVDDFRAGFETAGISLDVETDGEALFVDGDPTRLAQVFGNLLHNANKFTSREGRVRISVGRDRTRNEAVVVVADDGAGISSELLPRLFTPFCQADDSLDRSHGGLGLGLSLVKGLVDLHGGSVAVRSDGPARGSEFCVRLPLLGEGGLTQDGAPASRSRATCRALVIEDNTDAAESLRDALELLGHEVAVAYTGPEGIEVARSFRPDVVLCDIGLPVMNGYSVAREFRSDGALRRAFLVALSGYSMPEDVKRAMEAGFDLHLAKPPDLGRLEAVLGEAASRPIGGGVRG